MSRCILTLGIPRSGTSCIAGVLHKLGVDMGQGNFQNKDAFNSRGYYEDLRWRLANQRITGRGYSLKAVGVRSVGKRQRAVWRSLAREYRAKPLWGIKDPWLCFPIGRIVWTVLQNQGVDVRVVAVHRDLEASIASVRRHLDKSYGSQWGSARHIVHAWQAAYEDRLKEWDGQVYHCHYEELVSNTETGVDLLARYCFKGLVGPGKAQVGEAIRFVTGDLKHF